MGVVTVYAKGGSQNQYVDINWDIVQDYEGLKNSLKRAVQEWKAELAAGEDDGDYEEVRMPP